MSCCWVDTSGRARVSGAYTWRLVLPWPFAAAAVRGGRGRGGYDSAKSSQMIER